MKLTFNWCIILPLITVILVTTQVTLLKTGIKTRTAHEKSNHSNHLCMNNFPMHNCSWDDFKLQQIIELWHIDSDILARPTVRVISFSMNQFFKYQGSYIICCFSIYGVDDDWPWKPVSWWIITAGKLSRWWKNMGQCVPSIIISTLCKLFGKFIIPFHCLWRGVIIILNLFINAVCISEQDKDIHINKICRENSTKRLQS